MCRSGYLLGIWSFRRGGRPAHGRAIAATSLRLVAKFLKNLRQRKLTAVMSGETYLLERVSTAAFRQFTRFHAPGLQVWLRSLLSTERSRKFTLIHAPMGPRKASALDRRASALEYVEFLQGCLEPRIPSRVRNFDYVIYLYKLIWGSKVSRIAHMYYIEAPKSVL